MFLTLSIGKKYIKIISILITLLMISIFIHLFELNKSKSDLNINNNEMNESLDKYLDKYLDKSYDNLVFNDLNSNNITGFETKIVPNLIHYVIFDNHFLD